MFQLYFKYTKGNIYCWPDSGHEGKEELFSVCFLLDNDNVGYHPPVETIKRLILLLVD